MSSAREILPSLQRDAAVEAASPGVACVFACRVTIFTGYYGSGKTEVAIHTALALAASGQSVSLVDLDFLKPVFRSREMRIPLEEQGVRLVAPGGELEAADLPVVLPCVAPLLMGRNDARVLVDLAGDAGGAKAIAQYATSLSTRDHDLLMVVNTLRPFASTAERICRAAQELQEVTRMRITGLVANTNLGAESDFDMIEAGVSITRAAAERLEVPVRAVMMADFLRDGRVQPPFAEPCFWLHRRMLLPWER